MSLYLNIGCGNNLVDNKSWINIDNSIIAKIRRTPLWIFIRILININYFKKIIPVYFYNYPKLKIVDIRKKLPFPDNYFDNIYCSQVVEHLYKYDLIFLIEECYRVLKKGGTARFLTPDLDKIINLYNKNNLNIFKINDLLDSDNICNHFNTMFYPRSNVLNLKRSFITKLFDFVPQQHKYIYNFDTLSYLFTSNGFINTHIVDTVNSKFPDVKLLDRYQDVSLLLEASK